MCFTDKRKVRVSNSRELDKTIPGSRGVASKISGNSHIFGIFHHKQVLLAIAMVNEKYC
jgi:hypothetical protein